MVWPYVTGLGRRRKNTSFFVVTATSTHVFGVALC